MIHPFGVACRKIRLGKIDYRAFGRISVEIEVQQLCQSAFFPCAHVIFARVSQTPSIGLGVTGHLYAFRLNDAEGSEVYCTRTGIATGFLHHRYLCVSRASRGEQPAQRDFCLNCCVTRYGSTVIGKDISLFLVRSRRNHSEYHTTTVVRQHGGITRIHSDSYRESFSFTAVYLTVFDGEIFAIDPVRVILFLVGCTYFGNGPNLHLNVLVAHRKSHCAIQGT